MGVRVGIDTGGTFTDLVAVDEVSGDWYVAKVPSTPSDPVRALVRALSEAQFDSRAVSLIVVGTTIGINAVLTRTGAHVVYVTTKGFEDIPYIQRINRKHHYDFRWRKPTPFVQRRDCVGVDERVDAEGRVIRGLDAKELRQVLAPYAGREVAIAICFLFAYLNGSSERAAREAIREIDPSWHVSLSHEVAPIWREFERGTAAILDAYLKPSLDRYVTSVTEAFRKYGISSTWSLLKSNGGHALASEARDRPSHILLSGVAGGAIGGAYVARTHGATKAIVLDMGGTSCDICLVTDGDPLFSSEFEIEFGLPVAVPTVSSKPIGAGGGSIGWIDPGGFLQVGPRSAGADPGPACYAQGGSEPTLTDANLILGRLNPDYFLGGSLPLARDQSVAALERLAAQLGVDTLTVAWSMIRVANENMANAVRIITVEQGVDPRDFALVAMGGAGPTHAADIAEALGIRRVIVPLHPGLTSAFGAMVAKVRVDVINSIRLTSTSAAHEVEAQFAALEARAVESYRAQGSFADGYRVERFIAMRYEGQNYEQEMPVGTGAITTETLAAVLVDYHELYYDFYGYRLDSMAVEFVRLGVTVMADGAAELPTMRLEVGGQAAAKDPPAGRTAQVYFGDGGFQATAVVPRTDLKDRQDLAGPMVVESMDSTIVVPPGWRLEADSLGMVELHKLAVADVQDTTSIDAARG